MPDVILLGLTESEDIRQVLFILILLIYLITMLGNAGMILIILLDPQLHTPMYFFLSHLSFMYLSYSTIIIPKTFKNLLTYNQYITFKCCFTQMYFFVFSVVTECFFLTSVAYDLYVAIFKPIHYQVVMSRRLRRALITGSYRIGFKESLVIVLHMNRLHFCKSSVIYHFFCDTTPILALSCTDSHDTEIMRITLSSLNIMVSLTTISVSYGSILSTLLKINSTSAKCKAFSTCASHFLGVTIFYGSTIFTYLKTKKSYTLGKAQVDSVFYTMVIPMLNPLIYSLRNKEVKNALIRVMQKSEASRQLKCQ